MNYYHHLLTSAETNAGADDGTRTRDPHLGKVMLYQLSHIRMLRSQRLFILDRFPQVGQSSAMCLAAHPIVLAGFEGFNVGFTVSPEANFAVVIRPIRAGTYPLETVRGEPCGVSEYEFSGGEVTVLFSHVI